MWHCPRDLLCTAAQSPQAAPPQNPSLCPEDVALVWVRLSPCKTVLCGQAPCQCSGVS